MLCTVILSTECLSVAVWVVPDRAAWKPYPPVVTSSVEHRLQSCCVLFVPGIDCFIFVFVCGPSVVQYQTPFCFSDMRNILNQAMQLTCL